MATLRLRAQPLLDSFLGTMDLKLGATLITLFAGLNKVAGAYGLLAVLLSGGAALSQPVAQLTMYGYSIASLAALIWGLKRISEENGPQLLLYAHLFAADHLFSTVYTAFFAVVWYAWVPHDGRRVANSDAQKAMMGGSQTGGGMGEAERTRAAMEVWEGERGFSAAVLVVGWLLKVYFILVLYSFALHVRRGTYNSLPQSQTIPSAKFNTASTSSGRQRTHTRHSSAGGPAYTHLRGNSLASTAGIGGGRGSIDGLDGTETTLAETLWEDGEGDSFESAELGQIAAKPPALGERRPSRTVPAPVATRLAASSGNGDAPASPAFAKGTGMARTASGGVTVSGGAAPQAKKEEESARKEQEEARNPFNAILGRMSREGQR